MLSLPGPALGILSQCKGLLGASQGDYKHKVNKIGVCMAWQPTLFVAMLPILINDTVFSDWNRAKIYCK